ncbi:hypothetical protein HY745_03680 [Candidatus Desantisbacteria bacterium]|nr:hypothetical protein [Candidatus Desantisbacteria bacterium]
MSSKAYKIAFNEEDAADDFYEFLIRFELEENIKKSASFVFRLSIFKHENGEWAFLDDERFELFTKITISIGTKEDSVKPVFKGYITQTAPHFDRNEELCYLEVRGMDPTCLMNLEEKFVDWSAQSHSDIACAIFNSYGITPFAEEASVTHTEDGNVLVQRNTDIRFLKELAVKNGFDCYTAVDESGELKGYFKPLTLDSAPLPVLAVHFEGKTNVQFMDVQVVADMPLSISGWYLNLEDKTIEQIEKSEYDHTLLGKESLINIINDKVAQLSAPLEAVSRIYKGDIVFQTVTELEKTIQGNLNRSGWFIKAVGIVNSEIYEGIIRARQIVPVKGMGTRYSGDYLVSSVKHIISKDNYEQHIELIRNARGVKGNESFEGEA